MEVKAGVAEVVEVGRTEGGTVTNEEEGTGGSS